MEQETGHDCAILRHQMNMKFKLIMLLETMEQETGLDCEILRHRLSMKFKTDYAAIDNGAGNRS